MNDNGSEHFIMRVIRNAAITEWNIILSGKNGFTSSC